MIRVKIIATGSLKEPFYKAAAAEYEKRLSRYVTLNIHEIPDQKAPETLSAAQRQDVLEQEGKRILKAIPQRAYCVALCIEGKRMDSEAFAQYLDAFASAGQSELCFIIGGSLGLSDSVLARADAKLSLSDMTMCHPLARIVLLEQIYRACRINAGAPYHK